MTPGARLTPTEAQNQPKVSWEAEDGAFYTLIMNGELTQPHLARACPNSRVVQGAVTDCLLSLTTARDRIPAGEGEKV